MTSIEPVGPAAAAPLCMLTQPGALSETSPPALPPAPPSTRTLPPIDAPWLLPALTDTSPPAPLAPCPTLMLTAPPWPPDDAPLTTETEPDGPAAEAPERSATAPLAQPVADAIDTSPLDAMALQPLQIEADPPNDDALPAPLAMTLLPTPAITVTTPPAPALLSPARRAASPPAPLPPADVPAVAVMAPPTEVPAPPVTSTDPMHVLCSDAALPEPLSLVPTATCTDPAVPPWLDPECTATEPDTLLTVLPVRT